MIVAAGGPFGRAAAGAAAVDLRSIQPAYLATIGNVYQVTPTLLHLLGLPVAQDMKAGVMTGVLDPTFLEERPVAEVKTYETDPQWFSRRQYKAFEAVDAERMEQLRALGYIR
jgi:hypothetical protein